jgi:hypothetical protein
MTDVLSFVEAAEAEPFRLAAAVVLLRPGVAEEVQLRIREVAAEVHRRLPVAGAHQQERHRVRVRRLYFYGAARVRESFAMVPVAVGPHFQPAAPVRARLLKMSDR